MSHCYLVYIYTRVKYTYPLLFFFSSTCECVRTSALETIWHNNTSIAELSRRLEVVANLIHLEIRPMGNSTGPERRILTSSRHFVHVNNIDRYPRCRSQDRDGEGGEKHYFMYRWIFVHIFSIILLCYF